MRRKRPIIWVKRVPNLIFPHRVTTFRGIEQTDNSYSTECPIYPPVSDFLYTAMAGHQFKTNPETANKVLARSARAFIASAQMPILREYDPQVQLILHHFQMAHSIIMGFGPHIFPGLGTPHLEKQRYRPLPLLNPFDPYNENLN